MVFTTPGVLIDVYFEVCMYSRASDPRLYPFLDDMPAADLSRLCGSLQFFLGTIKRFEIKDSVRSSFYPVEYAEEVLHRVASMECDRNPHLRYCPYSRDETSLLHYPAYGKYH